MRADLSITKIVLLVASLVALFAFFSLGNLLYRSYQIDEYQTTLRQDITELAAESERLKSLLDYTRTDRFVVREAKELMDRREAGESVYLLTGEGRRSLDRPRLSLSPTLAWRHYFFKF